MFKENFLPRNFLIYAACVPLALLIGYLLATPLAFTSFATIGLCLGIITLPLLLRYHHALLFFTWNAYVIVFFLPGQPMLGFVMAAASLGLVILERAMGKGTGRLEVPPVAWSLIFLAVAVAVTAKLTGGIGGRVFGAETWGAKRYLGVFGAIMGYFAMVSQSIPEGRRLLYASLFMLSGTTALASDLAFAAGSKFYFLFYFFPSVLAGGQADSQDTFLRLAGVGFAGQSANFFMLMRYGIRGVLDFTKPWRMIFFLGSFAVSLFGGFRSLMILSLLLYLAQFLLEGLLKTRFALALIMVVSLMGVVAVGSSEKLPLSVQRTLSFLPLKVDDSAKQDARGSLEWRLLIWKVVVPEIPQYLFRCKGFAYSGTDSYLTMEAMRRGLYPLYEEALISGSYHQGILSLIIPFGIWGVIGFVWFCWAALKVLYVNYRNSPDELRVVNTFLISYFIARLIFYLFIYGQFELDFYHFTGTIGLSIALNGGVRTGREKALETEPVPAGI